MLVVNVLDVETPHGLARAHLHPVDEPRAALLLMHGAGVGVDSPDLAVATEAANAEGLSVALMEQPYRVAGRKSPAPEKQLDAAYKGVVERLRAGELEGLPLIAGGRSLGARVACRTAEELGAIAVLCLAFPFQPPQRKGAERKPPRLEILDAVSLPVLIVQGDRDQFGMPPEGPNRTVAVVPGNHSLKADLGAVAGAIREWLPTVVTERSAAR